jgi:hypothetical protein
MDTRLIVESEIKAKLETCIFTTNSIIKRWITINNVSPSKIKSEDVRAIFLGIFRKTFKENSYDWKDFKRYSNSISLNIGTDCFITTIYYSNIPSYFINRGRAECIYKCIDNIDYKEIANKVKDYNYRDNLSLLEETIENESIEDLLNFELIKNVKF